MSLRRTQSTVVNNSSCSTATSGTSGNLTMNTAKKPNGTVSNNSASPWFSSSHVTRYDNIRDLLKDPRSERLKAFLRSSSAGIRETSFEQHGEIGRGQFGSVHKVSINIPPDGSTHFLVWKQIRWLKMREKELCQVKAEVDLLRLLDHPSIVTYYRYINDRHRGQIYLLMEYCENGDLARCLQHTVKKGYPLPEKVVLSWFSQLVDALDYCHHSPDGQRVLHRDIKPQNVLLTDNYRRVKLADFGLAKLLAPHQSMAETHVGTPYYMSPEVLDRQQYDSRSDIWSLGCLLYELLTGSSPFADAGSFEQLRIMVADSGDAQALIRRTPSIVRNYSVELVNLVQWMLSLNPQDRPTAAQLKHSLAFRLGLQVLTDDVRLEKAISGKEELERLVVSLETEIARLRQCKSLNSAVIPSPRFGRTAPAAVLCQFANGGGGGKRGSCDNHLYNNNIASTTSSSSNSSSVVGNGVADTLTSLRSLQLRLASISTKPSGQAPPTVDA